MDTLLATVFCTLKPSPIHGIGVFALRDIPAGTKVIWEYADVGIATLYEDEFAQLPTAIANEILNKTIFVEGELLSFIDPNSVSNYRSYMNHSDTPNTDGITATRDIKEGEEITEDYRAMGTPHRLTRAHMPFLWK